MNVLTRPVTPCPLYSLNTIFNEGVLSENRPAPPRAEVKKQEHSGIPPRLLSARSDHPLRQLRVGAGRAGAARTGYILGGDPEGAAGGVW